MRLLALFYILLFNIEQSYSQKIVFEYDPQFKTNAEGRAFSNVRLNSSDSGKIVYIIYNENDIIYLLLSNDFVVEKKLSPANGLKSSIYQYEGNRVLGSVINDKTGVVYSIHFFIKANPLSNSIRREHFRIETIDFMSQKLHEQAFFEPEEGEHYLAQFEYGNRFYLITCINESKKLTVRILDENGTTTKKDFSLSELNKVLLQDQLYNYLSPAASFVDNSDFRNLGADYPVKVFMENENTILFTLATQKKVPEILRLDLETSKSEFLQVSSDELCISEDKKNFNRNNSYFYDGKLYVLNICKRKVQLFKFDLSTRSIENKYELNEQSDLQFSETPVMYANRDGRRTTDYLIYKTDILRELYNGAPKIFVNKEASGRIMISFGVYSEKTENGDKFVRSTSPLTELLSGTGGSSNLRYPRQISESVPMIFSSEPAQSVKSLVNCKMILDVSNNPIKLKTPQTSLTQSMDYCNKLSNICSSRAIVRIKGKCYTEYFNIATRTICLEEIPIKN